VRIDVVTIFPEYLAALDVSLIGKARREGLLDIHVHDLRDHAFDRHRTVDDTPYGGGAGMVMKPEPWALALEAIAAAGAAEPPSAEPPSIGSEDAGPTAGERPVLLVPTPSGTLFRQSVAQDLSTAGHLVVACGRYEGIDERVFGWAAELFDVRLVSLGDYVLNGGEVAALAMIEAVGRLVPGVVGNPESLVEESHSDGLLEYPVYTKPSSWRGRDVPEILLSGDHGRIATWRREQQLVRTRDRRPDLLPHDQPDAEPEAPQRDKAAPDLA
jgi:tRNA (guanine37-N1)-methyltransferase